MIHYYWKWVERMLNNGKIIKNLLEKGIKTERLCLRKFSLGDVADMFEYTSDKDNWNYIARDAHTDISQAENFICENIEKYDNPSDISWGIELSNSGDPDIGKLIGSMRIYDIDFEADTCMISYIINATFSGKGYMTEAIQAVIRVIFHTLKIGEIFADIMQGNRRSEKVAQRCGMVKILDHMATIEIQGQSINMYRYSIKRNFT